MDVFLIVAAAAAATGWTVGAALVAFAAFSGVAPRGWALWDLAQGRARWTALRAGLILLVAESILFEIVFGRVFFAFHVAEQVGSYPFLPEDVQQVHDLLGLQGVAGPPFADAPEV